MRNLLLVGFGGFMGSAARYALGGLVTGAATGSRFPFGTMAVNLLGCFAMGVLSGLAERQNVFAPATRLFLLTGLLGGFTTFSAFAYETFFLARSHAWIAALANISLQVVLGLLLLYAGHNMVPR